MLTIRKDYILDRWVYYSVKRGERPHEFVRSIAKSSKSKLCFFCPGNEKLTPPEIGRLEYKGKWRMRWFPNKFAVVEKKVAPKTKSKNLFTEMNSYGVHEVIVETQHHHSQLWDLPANYIKDLLEIIKVRAKELSRMKGIKYVVVFKNNGAEGGTSLTHSHTQVVAVPQIPTLVQDEINASLEYKKRKRRCAYCDIVKKESKSKRKIFENKNFVAIAPYASRFNYEAWLFPKRHITTLDEMGIEESKQFAEILKKILMKLKSINASYNFFMHYSPNGDDLHLHMEITPRLAKWAGFELSTNFIINSVMPEDAARFYKSRRI